MEAVLEEAILYAENFNEKFSLPYLGIIFKAPTKQVTDSQMRRTTFRIVNRINGDHIKAKTIKVVPFTPYSFFSMLRDSYDYKGDTISYFKSCGFQDWTDAKNYMNKWYEDNPDISFKDSLALYLFKRIS